MTGLKVVETRKAVESWTESALLEGEVVTRLKLRRRMSYVYDISKSLSKVPLKFRGGYF